MSKRIFKNLNTSVRNKTDQPEMFAKLQQYTTTSTEYQPLEKAIPLKDIPVEEHMVRTFKSVRRTKHYDLSKHRDKDISKAITAALDELTAEFPNHEVFILDHRVTVMDNHEIPNVFRFSASRNDEAGKIFITLQLKREQQAAVDAFLIEESYEESMNLRGRRKMPTLGAGVFKF